MAIDSGLVNYEILAQLRFGCLNTAKFDERILLGKNFEALIHCCATHRWLERKS